MAARKYKADTIRFGFMDWFVGEESEDGEQRAFCPLCEDPEQSKTPSASFNAEEDQWNCLKGNHGGTISELIQDLKESKGFNIRSAQMVGRNKKKGQLSEATLPSAQQIDKWVANLLGNKVVLAKFMEKRGLSIETIEQFEIGWDGDRFTIPVYDEDGILKNVRRYKMGATSSHKMLNISGCGGARIYFPEVLQENDIIVLTEGELDCIVLNQAGIPAVTHTGGCGTFKTSWSSMFSGKEVYICYDNDSAGQANARNKVAKALSSHTSRIYNIQVPLIEPGSDVTDFLVVEGHSADEFRKIMRDAESLFVGAPTSNSQQDSPTHGEVVGLAQSVSQELQGRTIELVVSVTGKQSEPYTAPKTVTATCDISKGALCEMCPIAAHNGSAEVLIAAHDERIFGFIDTTSDRRKKLIKEICGARCSDRVEFDTQDLWYIEEILVQPSVDEASDGSDDGVQIRRPVFSVSTHNTRVNEKVKLVGRNVVDSRSGVLRFMSWINEPIGLDIDNFVLDDEMRSRLDIFRTDPGQPPLDRCLEISNNLATNVTHIYGRDILHVAYDLVWHSALSFNAGNVRVPKGWLEMLVAGDTRTGKSEVASKLQRHYGSGRMISCEGMSFAGVVGGVQQVDKKWHMTWGIVPMNDRRLVVLDEMSGLADKNIIDQMSSIRSSGIAQITKIVTEQTMARTRIIWITNPQDGSMIHDNQEVGMAAVRSVASNAEDQARFDFVMAVAKNEVPDKLINTMQTVGTHPKFSAMDCEALIKWVWSLDPDHIVITDTAMETAIDTAQDLGRRYVPDPPFIQAENIRFKILRIAVAIAARTFSEKDGMLVVTEDHVDDAVRFLDLIYASEAMGYQRKSRRMIHAAEIARSQRMNAISWLKQHEDTILAALRAVGGNTFRARDFVEFGGMPTEESHQSVKKMMGMKMAIRMSHGNMKMSSSLVEALRYIEDEDEFGPDGNPATANS
jgi:hypothetical protein